MLVLLSGDVIRSAVVLSLGWLLLAGVVIGTSGSVAPNGENAQVGGGARPPSVSKAIALDQLDPCTQEPLALDTRLSLMPLVHQSSDLTHGNLIHTELLVAMYGSIFTGENRIEQRIAIADHVGFVRTLAPGFMDPYELSVRVVERPTAVDTRLSVRVQPFWNGTSQFLAMTETHLKCL